jgi:hypothetical protein
LEREHPTVSLNQHWRIPLIQELTDWSPELFAALREMRVHGQVSQVVVDRVGAHVIRLGTVFPGRGETLDSVRPQVERQWRQDQKRNWVQSELNALRRSYRIATWPDRLRDGLSPAASAGGGGSEP